MSILQAIVYDTLLTYGFVLLACIVLGSLRFRFGRRWIGVAFIAFFVSWLISEALASVDDKDAVFLIGALLRLVISTGLLAAALAFVSKLKRWFLPAVDGDS